MMHPPTLAPEGSIRALRAALETLTVLPAERYVCDVSQFLGRTPRNVSSQGRYTLRLALRFTRNKRLGRTLSTANLFRCQLKQAVPEV